MYAPGAGGRETVGLMAMNATNAADFQSFSLGLRRAFIKGCTRILITTPGDVVDANLPAEHLSAVEPGETEGL